MEKNLSNKIMRDDQPLRLLPAVDKILQHDRLTPLRARLAPEFLAECARRAVAELRAQWQTQPPAQADELAVLAQAVELTVSQAQKLLAPRLKKVINATGIILHTGLGRAVLSEAALAALRDLAPGYCNLEIDLETGKRGDRHLHVENVLGKLTGAEAACVVNNNAAAVLLALNTIADKKEIMLSRGQMVEIGGAFRMPEVVKKSGARLVEIGTTNKTKLQDYAAAITPKSAGILVAHTSNYRILGFTHEVALKDLVELAHRHGLVLVHDLGGGVLVDLRQWGLPYEPFVSESIQAGVDLVTFSGDKILGGPQCGLIVGRKELIQRLKKNPLMRALRCDKLTLALLENTLRLFLHPESLREHHAVIHMLTEDVALVQQRAQRLHDGLRAVCAENFFIKIEATASEAGSGALPIEKIPSFAVTVRSTNLSAAKLAKALRLAETPIIGYVQDDCVWLDARTLGEEEVGTIIEAFRKPR